MSLVRFSNSMPSVFDRFFEGDMLEWSKNNLTLPSVNIKEDEKGFELELAAPGFDKSDIKIEIDKGVLTISSEKKEENKAEEKNKHYSRKEFSYQSFRRAFTLPENVDGDIINASYDKGILSVNIPKKEEKTQSTRFIEIK